MSQYVRKMVVILVHVSYEVYEKKNYAVGKKLISTVVQNVSCITLKL